MRIFCDTSVLIAASVKSHEHHSGALSIFERVAKGKDIGIIGIHSLAEVYSVMTRLPVSPRIQPGEAIMIIKENIIKYFHVQTLSAGDYTTIIDTASARGLIGGAIYDALLLACAEKAKTSRIYTFNLSDFKRIAPHLASIISTP